ncbi:MAG TPA: hypothetical protein PLG34_10255 [Spirochaetota bacterium]|jgi:hypothetical protein|nr:MAG: hypothetical protein BWX91_01680 [Spirochaetes bacterium ADurb.Bin133]HNZ26201.1 hypothetical protein [Spirochaetota bacterium]HPY88353.1 hypothetical protein [Spirochaetota bacterium]HQB60264.1 hypothetical protein [Spirochaetota bacterium]
MVTNFAFEKAGNFSFTATPDFDDKNRDVSPFLSKKDYENSIAKLLCVKKTITRSLADDNDIVGEERLDLIKTLDAFLSSLVSFSYVFMDMPGIYCSEIPEKFNLTVKTGKTRLAKGSGTIFNVSSDDVEDYRGFIDDKIISKFKEFVSLSGDIQTNKQRMADILENLFYNAIVLRFKVEYF